METPLIGTVLYVKTTEEPTVFIAAHRLGPQEKSLFPENNGSHMVYVVRRPVGSEQYGLQYKFFDFLAEELETFEEQNKRRMARVKAQMSEEMSLADPFSLPPAAKKPS